MPAPVLTIAIPTYNRPEKVLLRLLEIISQNPKHTNVIVIDNCSETTIQTFIQGAIEKIPEWISFQRNRANIGACGNICRCIECATGSWVWLLGDDDSVEPNSIQTILTEIDKLSENPQIAGVNFSTGIQAYQKYQIFKDLRKYCEFLNDPTILCNSFFISSYVINVNIALKYLRQATQAISTFVPHAVIPLAALSDNKSWVISPEKIVNHVPPDSSNHWNTTTVSLGLPLILDFGLNTEILVSNLSKSLPFHIYSLNFRSAIKKILMNNSRDSCFWELYYLRVLPLMSGINYIKILSLALFCRLIRNTPLVKKLLSRIAGRFFDFQFECPKSFDRL